MCCRSLRYIAVNISLGKMIATYARDTGQTPLQGTVLLLQESEVLMVELTLSGSLKEDGLDDEVVWHLLRPLKPRKLAVA